MQTPSFAQKGRAHLFGTQRYHRTPGLCAPLTGRVVDRHGGRFALMTGALLGAFGFAVLANTHSVVLMFVGWSINGVAMALGLYEACFATIGQLAPSEYPRLVTGVTLIAGFSSTVSWPASHYLLEAIGWRNLCFVYDELPSWRLQVTFNQRDAARLGLLTFVGFFVSVVTLLASRSALILLIRFAITYGIANGVVTIVKATLPVQLLGGRNIGHLLGTFSRPALITRALAPWLFAMTVSTQGVWLAVDEQCLRVHDGSIVVLLAHAKSRSSFRFKFSAVLLSTGRSRFGRRWGTRTIQLQHGQKQCASGEYSLPRLCLQVECIGQIRAEERRERVHVVRRRARIGWKVLDVPRDPPLRGVAHARVSVGSLGRD